MRDDDPADLDAGSAAARPAGVIHVVPPPADADPTELRFVPDDGVEDHGVEDDGDDHDEDEAGYRDWRWVEEWRAEQSGPAWAPGITLAVFVAALVAVALLVLTAGLSDTSWLAILVNVVIAAGMAPALWLSRNLPVLRFLAAGAAVGLVVGWIWMLLTFPG